MAHTLNHGTKQNPGDERYNYITYNTDTVEAFLSRATCDEPSIG